MPAMAVGSMVGRTPVACTVSPIRSQPALPAPRALWSAALPRANYQHRTTRRFIAASSSSEPEASVPASMSLEEAYTILNVSKNAGFEEILSAKKKLTKQSPDDRERIIQVRFLVAHVRRAVTVFQYAQRSLMTKKKMRLVC